MLWLWGMAVAGYGRGRKQEGTLIQPRHPPREIWVIIPESPFVNGTFEWGVVIASFLSVLRSVPRHCARLTYFFDQKKR